MAASDDTCRPASSDRHATVTLRIIEEPHSDEEFHFESYNTLIVGPPQTPSGLWPKTAISRGITFASRPIRHSAS